MFYSWGMT